MTSDSGLVEDAPRTDYSDRSSTFGDRLVLARESLGLEQTQLAHGLGVKMQTLKNWEEDRAEPRANKLHMLAGMLNVSMIWLLTGQGEAPSEANPVRAEEQAEACLAELRGLRAEQTRLAEQIGRIEKRLRTAMRF